MHSTFSTGDQNILICDDHSQTHFAGKVISQFCCTSVWFAGNGVMSDLVLNYHLDQSALGHLTSAVQFGFISGTLIFSMLRSLIVSHCPGYFSSVPFSELYLILGVDTEYPDSTCSMF